MNDLVLAIAFPAIGNHGDRRGRPRYAPPEEKRRPRIDEAAKAFAPTAAGGDAAAEAVAKS